MEVNKKVTIKDVAKKANVTAQTVSRVLRKEGYVAKATEEKVLKAVKELNYVSSYAAKALRTGMSRSIALVFDSLKNVYFSLMIDYLRKKIKDYGFSVRLFFSEEHVITENTYRKAISHGAVGVISFLESSEGLGDIVKRLNVPLLILGRTSNEEGIDYITTNDKNGGMLAAKYLIDNNCSDYYYIVEGWGMSCTIDRYEGFLSELKKHSFDAKIIEADKISPEEIFSRDYANKKLGVFCFNDALAFNALKLINANNFNNEICLVGYDNINGDLDLPINLASIGLDKDNYAEFVIKCLVEKIEKPNKVFKEECQVKLYC